MGHVGFRCSENKLSLQPAQRLSAVLAVTLCAATAWIASPARAKTVAECKHEYLERAAGLSVQSDEKKFVRSCVGGKGPPSSANVPHVSPAATTPVSRNERLALTQAASNEAASKESDNPVTRWITAPLRYESEFLDGPDKLTKSTFELDQAVVPFKLNEDWALITRTKLPFEWQPPKSTGASWSSGLSNGYTTFFLSPEHGYGDFYWGVGPVLYYPASNTNVGVDQWGSGPSAAFVVKGDSPWVYGVVANNIWSIGPGPLSDRTNRMLLNPFISYHLGDGWAIGSSPILKPTGSPKEGSGQSPSAAVLVRL
jgi:hypothetical protein